MTAGLLWNQESEVSMFVSAFAYKAISVVVFAALTVYCPVGIGGGGEE